MGEPMLEIFKNTGAISKGHFLLSSGKHSEYYIQCAQVLQYPAYTEQLVRNLAEKLNTSYDLVVGPAMGGIILAYEMARYFNIRAIFTEREQDNMKLRRDFSIKQGEEVLVVEDVITTGGSVMEVIELIRSHGGRIKDVAALINRSGDEIDFNPYGLTLTSLINFEIVSYNKDECPLCKKGIQLTKPGSKKFL